MRKPVKRGASNGEKVSLWKTLGPGLVSGAADDDPSGIATYSQAGAAQGFDLLWTVWLTLPLMLAIQLTCARIGRVTGRGLAANIRERTPRPLLYAIVALLFFANTINIAADVAAMGAAMKLLLGGPALAYALALGAASLLLQIFVPYRRYERALKLLALALFAYVATVLFIKVPWTQVAYHSLLPANAWNSATLMLIVAVFGTTISPYLFFWQASHEVEEEKSKREKPLKQDAMQGVSELRRIALDTTIGMVLSNVVAFCIMITAAAVLHAQGVNEIETSAQAAQALRPLAGRFAFALFAAGIVGTGLLAVPVLAGASAYAAADVFGWTAGLGKRWSQARAFYAVIAVSMLAGMALAFAPLDPVKALVLSAVINGIVAVPIMVLIMRVASTRHEMGRFVVEGWLLVAGWLATAVMAAAAIALIANLLLG